LGTIEGLAEDAILTASIDLRKTAAIPRFSKSIPDFGRRTPDLLRSARKLHARHTLRRMRRRPMLVMAFWQQAELFPL
jgi:hypothetical protein